MKLEIPSSNYSTLDTLAHTDGSCTQLAVSRSTGERVAIKSLLTNELSSGALMRIQYEANLLAQLNTSAYASPIDVFSDDQAIHIVAPFTRGVPLSKRVEVSPLDVKEVLHVAHVILTGLIAIHEKRILHRAVRPSHILVNSTGKITTAKLIDFGSIGLPLSKVKDTDRLAIHARYYSPEQAGSIDHDLIEASDLYSLGATLFEALAGYPPYTGPDLHTILFRHMTSCVPDLRELGLPIPRAFDEVIQRLLRKDPRERYQSADAALADVQAIRDGLSAGVDDPRVVIGGSDCRNTLVEPSFVARDEEIEAFDGVLEKAAAGSSQLITLEGESGSGKSRLLTEVAHRATKQGFRVHRGMGRKDVAQHPFQVFDGVVKGFIALAKSDPEYAAHVKSALDQDVDIVASSIPDLQEVYPTSTSHEFVPEMMGEMRTIRALSAYLHALGTKTAPTLIILDDCQWADELTIKLIRYWQNQIVSCHSHVVLVVGFRSEEGAGTRIQQQIESSNHLKLSMLPPDDVRKLAESMAGRLPEEAIDLVIELGGGSPFMSAAVLHGLVESEGLVFEERQWRIDPLAIQAIHSTNRQTKFLTRRLELLSESVLRFLTIGSVIGKEFNAQMAAVLSGLQVEDAMSAMDTARKRQLLWCRPDGVTCVFMHDQIRRALIERLSSKKLQAYHLSAAKYYQDQTVSRTAELAYHFDAAGACELAFPYALEAAEHARHRHALETAQQQYEIARRGVAHHSKELQYRVAGGLGDVLMLRGKYETAGTLFEEAAHLATNHHSKAQIRGKLAELSFKRGDVERSVGDYEQALRILHSWIPTQRSVLALWLIWELFVQVCHTFFPSVFVHRRKTDPSESQRLKIRLFSGLAHGNWYCRGALSTLWAHFRGLNLAEVYGPTSELGNAYAEHAPVMSLLGLFDRAICYAQKSLSIRRELGDLWGQGQALHYYGVVLFAASRYSECITRCRESIRLLERMGDFWQVHMARYQIAASYLRLGELSAAIEESQTNYQSGLQLKDEQASGIILDVWARAAFGKVPQEYLDAELARKRFDAQGQAQLLFASGVCYLHRGQIPQALQQLNEAVRVTRCAGVCNSYTLPIQAWRVTAGRLLAESTEDYSPRRRRRLLRQAQKFARQAQRSGWHCKNDRPHILRERGLLYSLEGHPRRAYRCFQKSIRLAKQQQSHYDFAQSVKAMEKVAKEFGWSLSDKDLTEANAILTKLDVSHEVQQSAKPVENLKTNLSLADRFDTVLESGRQIAKGLSEPAIYQAVLSSASQLLRVQHGVVLLSAPDQPVSDWKAGAGVLDWQINCSLIENSLASRRSVGTSEIPTSQETVANVAISKSELCAPLYLRGRPVGCLYVMHSDIRGLFGKDEERLADFLATIAAAALENAEGFAELQNLNATLEKRVANRTAVLESRSQELATSNHELERTAHELRQTQVQLSASKLAAEEASAAKSRFLATMSHEIRTPMNGILGMADLMLNSVLNNRQRGHLETLKGSANALLTLLNDLLDFSKIEAGKMELEAIAFSLRDVVLDSVRLLAVQAGQKGLELICRVDSSVPVQTVGDPNRLRQVLVNLLGNAIKFTSQGEVRVHVSVQASQEKESNLRFSIHDTGIGIPAEKQQYIFEAFHQTDSSVTRRFGGTGLGLAISTQLVELMDGRIHVESEEGQGTTFHVDIPFALPDSMPQFAEIDLSTLEPQFVLRSDHAESGQAIRELLDFLHIPVAADLSTSEFDSSEQSLIPLVDLNLQSDELIDELREKIARGDFPVNRTICFTPAGSSELVEECEALGIDHVLMKPAKPQEIVSAVQSVLDQSPVPDSADDSLQKGQGDSLFILVADDSPVNREVAEGMMEMLGHRSHAVANGAEAVEALQQQNFDLVFMDIEMPVMDGYAAARAIRELSDSKSNTPIYAMTAHALSETHQKCQEAGMDGFITKPIMPDELLRVFNQLATLV